MQKFTKIRWQKLRSDTISAENGFSYRHPEYNGETDDRVHALAVLSGIAEKSQYEAIFRIMKSQWHASPYMEKYVMESLFQMGQADFALDRVQKRFGNMINDKNHTTLFEGWEIGGFGGGSTNHAWSGGAVTVLSQYMFGIYPLEPAWKSFKIEPYPSKFKKGGISIPSVAGTIKYDFEWGREEAFNEGICAQRFYGYALSSRIH